MPVQKIEKRDFLLRCWEVFHLNGYYNTSMQDLAAATGLQKAGLYHHYPTKQVLMERVMEFALDEFRSYVLSVADDETLPVEQRLEKLLRRHKKLATLHRRGCFFANTALETGREELFNNVLMTAMNEWADTVGRLLAHYLPADEARALAERLVMEYEGAVLFYKLTANEKYLEDFVHRTIALLPVSQSS
jgi:AcrR family transcriptional regulator